MLHERIKARRLELGITQVQMSEALGCAQQHYSAIETGWRDPKAAILCAIADKLSVSMDWLCERTDVMPVPKVTI